MTKRSSCFSIVAAGVLLLAAGCSSVPEGYTRQQWQEMSPQARKQVLRRETVASDQMRRDLARDAATENGFLNNSHYSR